MNSSVTSQTYFAASGSEQTIHNKVITYIPLLREETCQGKGASLCGRACCGEGCEQDLSVIWKGTCRKKLLDLHQPVKGSFNISVHIRPVLVEFLLGFVCLCKMGGPGSVCGFQD